MFAILHALGMFVANLFKSQSRLEAENVFLRHQRPRYRLSEGVWSHSMNATESISRLRHLYHRPDEFASQNVLLRSLADH